MLKIAVNREAMPKQVVINCLISGMSKDIGHSLPINKSTTILGNAGGSCFAVEYHRHIFFLIVPLLNPRFLHIYKIRLFTMSDCKFFGTVALRFSGTRNRKSFINQDL